MDKKNSVFIGVSIDGYIADRNGGLEWLDMIPNTENSDMGYIEFTSDIDALVMGRTTFETVLGFDVDWPYEKPVFVLSTTLDEIPESHNGKAFLVGHVLRHDNKEGINIRRCLAGREVDRLHRIFLAQLLLDILPR